MKPLSISIRRRGMALLVVLVALAVLSVVLTVVTAQILAQRRHTDQRQRQLQADWLARAGIELAAARLLGNPAPFSVDHKDLAPDAKVRVVVEKSGPDVYDIRAEAEISRADMPAVIRSATGRFRRIDTGGVIRLEAAAVEKN